jgi:hypothetical protein
MVNFTLIRTLQLCLEILFVILKKLGYGYTTSADQNCLLCPAGTYQDGTTLTCQPCTGNSVSSSGAASCTSTCAFGVRDANGGLGICRYDIYIYI